MSQREQRVAEIVDSCAVARDHDEEIAEGRVFITAARDTLIRRIVSELNAMESRMQPNRDSDKCPECEERAPQGVPGPPRIPGQ